MKQNLVVFLICSLYTIAYARIDIGVWTDKSLYNYGDTIAVTITAYNPTADTAVLIFGSACQVSYIIDDFDLSYYIVCPQVQTSRKIPPFGTLSWDYLRYPCLNLDCPLLSSGVHVVVGEVWGYGKSDTLLIFVKSVTSVSKEDSHASDFLLGQNYPNPFNSITSIPFTVSRFGRVVIGLYNSLGQKVRTLFDDYCQPGSYIVKVELNDAPSGVYWCRLQSGGRNQTMKLILSK
jgi:hypothetical protein